LLLRTAVPRVALVALTAGSFLGFARLALFGPGITDTVKLFWKGHKK
jgi:hypothetical protein